LTPKDTADLEQAASLEAAGTDSAGTSRSASLLVEVIVTLGIIQLLAMILNLLRSKILALTVGLKGVGTISVVDQIAALIMQVSSFGLPYAALKYLSASHSMSREEFGERYGIFVRGVVILSSLGAAIGAIVIVWRPSTVGLEMSTKWVLILLVLAAIPLTNLVGLLGNVLAVARGARASAQFGLLMALSLTLLAGGGVLVGGLRGYYVGNLIAMGVLATSLIIYFAVRHDLSIRGSGLGILEQLKRNSEVARFSGATYILSFTAPAAFLILRYSVLRKGGFELAGVLQASMGPGLALSTVLRTSNSLFLTPSVNRRTGTDLKFAETVDFIRAISTAIAVMALPMVFFPQILLRLLYARGFVVASPFVYLFVLEEALGLIAGANQALIIGLDHIAIHVAICLVGNLELAALSTLLVPRFGVHGVAMAFLCNGSVIFVLTAYCLWKKHGLSVYRAMGWLPWLALSAIGVVGMLTVRLSEDTPAGIVVKVALYASLSLLLIRAQQGVPFVVIARRVKDFWR
jgi:O-antigen/teichoic acid export membrane protein